MNYELLRAELLQDPLALGYPADDQLAADKLNSLETGRSVKRADISPAELFELISMNDLPPLQANPTAAHLSNERRDLAWLGCLASLPSARLINDDNSDTQIRAELIGLFPAGSGTRTRLATMGTETVSRATELELGEAPTAGDVERARSGDY